MNKITTLYRSSWLFELSLAVLLGGTPTVWATANYVYHERTTNDPGCGGQYVTTLNPTAAQSYPLRFKIEYQFYTTTCAVYYTTNGSSPAGAFGTPNPGTYVAAGTYTCTFGSPVVDVASATIPAQPAGTTVKYILSAWHSSGGPEIFANSGEFISPFTTSAQATVFSYTVTTNLWDGNGDANSSGNWSTANNWSADVVPSGLDTAGLVNVGSGSRVVTYDSGAPGTLAGLLFNQTTAGSTNQLLVVKGGSSGTPSLTVTNAVTLDTGGNGVEELRLDNASTSVFFQTGSGANGLSIGSGGLLTYAFNTSGTTTGPQLQGGTTALNSGGKIEVLPGFGAGGMLATHVPALTIAGGTLNLFYNGTGKDTRFQVNGALVMTSGAIQRQGSGGSQVGLLLNNGGPNTFSGGSFDTNVLIGLMAAGNQSLTSSLPVGSLWVRATGDTLKTVALTAAGPNVGKVSFMQATADKTSTLKLGANMTVAPGFNLPLGDNFGLPSGTSTNYYGVDVNGYVFDLGLASGGTGSAGANIWRPNNSAASTSSGWSLTNSSATAGRIVAGAFVFTNAYQVNVYPNVILEATGGGGTNNNLSGGGSIATSSTFLYSGSASAANPATLTSTRNLGNLQVTGGGTLKLTNSTGLNTLSLVTLNSGTLDLAGHSVTVNGLTGAGTLDNSAAVAMTLTVGSNNVSTNFDGLITNSGTALALVKVGSGTLTLNGNNGYTGGTTISAGTLQLGSNGGAAGGIVGDIVNNGTLSFSRSGTLTLNGNISGTGSLTKNIINGTVLLGGNNSFNGNVAINNGEVRLTSSTALGNTTGITTLQGTTNRPALTLDGSGGALNVGETIQLANLKSTDTTTPGMYPFSGGLVNLAGNNTVSGEVNAMTGGSFSLIQSAGGKLTLSGTLRPGSSVSGTRYFRFAGAGAGEVSGLLAERSGWVSGDSLGFEKAGAGEWLLSNAANTCLGIVSISDGTLTVTKLANGGLPSSMGQSANTSDKLVLQGGTLKYVGAGDSTDRVFRINPRGGALDASGTGPLVFSNSGAHTINTGTTSAFAGFTPGSTVIAVSLCGGLAVGMTVSGTGITAGTTVTAVDVDQGLVTLSQPTTGSSTEQSLAFGGGADLDRTLTLTGNNSGDNEIKGILGNPSGAGKLALAKTGTGKWILSGNNTYGGDTTISGGTLKIGAADRLPDGAGKGNVTVNGTLDLGGFNETINALNGGGVVDNVTGSGGNSLTFGNNNASGSFSGNIQNTAGSLALTKTGTGTQTLGGNNTYSGTTTVSAGTLRVASLTAIPAGAGKGDVSVAGALDLNGYDVAVNGLSGVGVVDNLAGGGSVTFTVGSNHATGTFSGSIKNTSGTLALVKTGTNAITLSGANTYNGTTTVNGGQLVLAGSSALGNSPAVQVISSGGGTGLTGSRIDLTSGVSLPAVPLTLDATVTPGYRTGLTALSGSNVWNGPIVLKGNNVANVIYFAADAAGALLNIAGPVTNDSFAGQIFIRGSSPTGGGLISAPVNLGGSKIYKTDACTWTISSTGNVWSTTQISQGTIKLGADHALPGAADVLFGQATSGGTLDLAGFNQTVGGLSVVSTATGFSNVIGNSSTASDSRLIFNKAGSSLFGGVICDVLGAGTRGVALSVMGGTLILTNANTYTGDTSVSNGTLLVNGSTGGSAITVSGNGTLGGVGLISGVTVVNAGGTLAPGSAGIGTLTFGSPPTLAGMTLMEVNRNGGAPVADKLAGGGTLGGTLVVTNVGAALQTGDTFDLFDGSLTGSFAVTNLPHGLAHWLVAELAPDGNGTITFTNNTPVAGGKNYSVPQGGVIVIPLASGAKSLATDADGDTLTVTALGNPDAVDFGTASISGGGSSITYSNTSGAAGAFDSFSYTVSDGLGGLATNTITVRIESAQGYNLVSGANLGGNTIALTYLGIPGTNYVLDWATNLSVPVWTPVATNMAQTNGWLYFTNTGVGMDFYRTRYLP